MKTNLTFLLLLLVLGVSAYAQKPKDVLKWINTANAVNKDFYYEIPFTYKNNEIIIQVSIGGQVYDYIFDTGGYNNITDAIQQKNNFPVLTTQTVGSSNQVKTRINIVKADTLKIGQLVFTDLAVLQMNYDASPTIKCTIDGGLIGASIIKNYVCHIDYPNRKIIVTDKLKRILGLEKAVKVPVTFNGRLMPYIKVKINGRQEKMMFDTGSSALFSMTEETAAKYTKSKEVITIVGGGTEGANGALKESVSLFRGDNIAIAKEVSFANKPVLFAKSSNENLIGNAIIKNYIVTLNFKDDEMYFEPITNAPDKDGWKTFGLTIDYTDGKIKVATIYKGLQADKAGIAVGDEVVKIDNKIPGCTSYCDCRVWLSNYMETSNTILLTIIKNGETKEITIAKEKVF